MSEPTHVFIGVRHGRVFAIAATVETVSTWLEEEGADLIQRVPLAEARTLLFQQLPMLTEIDTLRAENEQLRDENTKLSDLAETRAEKLKGCPFDRDDFELDLDVPCPVCGSLGHSDSPNLCPYRPKALGRAAFSEAQP